MAGSGQWFNGRAVMTGVLCAVTSRSRGPGAPRVQLIDDLVESGGAGSRNAGVRVNASGAFESRIQGAYATLFTWILTGSASDYQVYCENSGGEGVGTFYTWLDATSSPTWYVVDLINDGEEVYEDFTIKIRDKVTLAELDSGFYSCLALRT